MGHRNQISVAGISGHTIAGSPIPKSTSHKCSPLFRFPAHQSSGQTMSFPKTRGSLEALHSLVVDEETFVVGSKLVAPIISCRLGCSTRYILSRIPPIISDSLDSLDPISFHVRPSQFFHTLMLCGTHRAADAAESSPTLIVEFTMGYLHHLVQELPYISLRPMDDGRDKKAFLSVDAAKRLFLVGIHDVHAVLLRFPPSLLR